MKNYIIKNLFGFVIRNFCINAEAIPDTDLRKKLTKFVKD